MSENKSEAVYLVPGDKTIYAIPGSVCEQYKLEGQSLEAAKIALSGDVVGQSNFINGYGGSSAGGGRPFAERRSDGHAYSADGKGEYTIRAQYLDG